jgi:hypothetical protein
MDLDDRDVEIDASLSIGVVAFPDDGRTADDLLIRADQAMYASKRLGKNRVTGVPTGPTTEVGSGARRTRRAAVTVAADPEEPTEAAMDEVADEADRDPVTARGRTGPSV